jgi:alpha-glucosidase (family GH31 glycosyl hydrolase)
VKPITKKIGENTLPIEVVHAPAGTWYSFHSGKVLKGQKLLMDVHLSRIPVLVKGGSFVPMSPIIQSTEAYADSLVTIHYYDGPELTESKGMWYEDDGLTNEAYEKGMFKLLQMNMSQNAKKTKLTFQPTYGSNMSQHAFTYDVMIHSSRIPKSISINGKKMKVEVIDQKIKLPMALKDEVQNIQINW